MANYLNGDVSTVWVILFVEFYHTLPVWGLKQLLSKGCFLVVVLTLMQGGSSDLHLVLVPIHVYAEHITRRGKT